MSEIERILDMHNSRMEALDVVVKSMDNNLTEITRVLETFSHHAYRLDDHSEKINDAIYRIDTLESTEDKNETVMKILNRIFIIGIPAMIASVFVMAGMLWYGMNNPQYHPINQNQIDVLLQKYITPKDPKESSRPKP